jgi:hypothetical protein
MLGYTSPQEEVHLTKLGPAIPELIINALTSSAGLFFVTLADTRSDIATHKTSKASLLLRT